VTKLPNRLGNFVVEIGKGFHRTANNSNEPNYGSKIYHLKLDNVFVNLCHVKIILGKKDEFKNKFKCQNYLI
jgi:hypothetical protein